MNQIDNTFTKGMNLDLHPSTIPSDTLISCLNGTIKTNNGNEGILQNDMGNVKLQYAHLPTGYIPVGMQEYGGIVYVASVRPHDNMCQIGSFPSPQQRHAENSDKIHPITFSEDIIKDFFAEEGKFEVIRSRVTKRLSDRLIDGTAFNIKINLNDQVDFPAYVHYKNTVQTIDNDLTKDFLVTLKIGLKNDQNSIVELNNVKKETNQSWNYLTNKGELYLIEQLNIPESKEFLVKNVAIEKSGITLEYYYDGNDSDISFTGGNKDITTYYDINEFAYKKIKFTGGISTLRGTILPTITYGTGTYTVNELKQDLIIDVNNYSSSALDGNKSFTYLSSYTEYNETLKIKWSLNNASSVTKVIFNFYKFEDGGDTATFGESPAYTQEITGKRTFNGFFTLSVTELDANSLYLVEIKCEQTNENPPETYYRWAWTSNLVKTYERKPTYKNGEIDEDDDNTQNYYEQQQTYDFPLYIEVSGNVSEDANEEDDTIYKGSTTPTLEGNIDYKHKYTKKVTFKENNLKAEYANYNKLPFTPPNITQNDYEYEITAQIDQIDNSFDSDDVITDKATAFINDSNQLEINAIYAVSGTGEQTTKQYHGKKLKPYLDDIEDYKKIFGQDVSDYPKYGVAIGAGSLATGGKNKCSCFVDICEWHNSGSIKSYDYNCVKQDSVNYNNTSGDDRRWGKRVADSLHTHYTNKVKTSPPISFILSPPTSVIRYNSDRKTSKLRVMGSGGVTSTEYINYSLVLWKDNTNVYRILRYFSDTWKGAFTTLQNLFKKLYVADTEPTTETISGAYVVKDIKYTKDNSLTVDVSVRLNIEVDSNFSVDDITKNISTALVKRISVESTRQALVDAITITLDSNAMGTEFSKSYTLDTKNVLLNFTDDIISTKNTNSTVDGVFCKINNSVATMDSNGNPLNGNKIYIEVNNKLKPFENATNSDLSGFPLADLYKQLELKTNETTGKNEIVLKSQYALDTSPNTAYKSAHAAPFIGRYMSGNPHAETKNNGTSGTYPFPFGGSDYGNYVYLCDVKLHNDFKKLW